MTDNNTTTITRQRKLDVFAQKTTAKIVAICRRNKVPQDVVDVFTADVIDMLHAKYDGLRASTEQMRTLTRLVKQSSWDKTENAVLCYVALFYADIEKEMRGTSSRLRFFLQSVEYCETEKRKGNAPTPTYDEMYVAAQRLYYTCAVLTIGEHTDATEDELRTIATNTADGDLYKERLIASALEMQRQRRRITAAAAGRKAQRAEDGQQAMPTLFDGEKTIHLYQSITNALSEGIKTADVDENGRALLLRPLRQAIEEQQAAAAELLADDRATDEQKAKARQLITTTTAVWQVIDGIQVIVQTIQPDESGGTYSRWNLTPRQICVICTGCSNPNNAQVLLTLHALAWLRTQSTQIWEQIEKRVTLKGEDGKALRDENGKPQHKIIHKSICTDFQPVVAEFRTEYENNVLIEDATLIRLLIHNIIRDGRSTDYYIDRSSGRAERFYIKPPTQHVLLLNQFYDFKSDEERAFRNIIVSKPQLAEDKFLAAVFDYPAKQREYEQKADEAARIAAILEDSPDATDKERQEAQKDAQRARDKAKNYITGHMGDDVERLKGMFAKAKDDGLITWYSRDVAKGIHSSRKYGSGFVYRWTRPNKDEIATRRQRRT